MSTPITVADHSTEPAPVLDPNGGPCSCLGPAEVFPAELGELSMGELQVLHSKICRQLDRDYLTTLDGPHPCTTDRLQDVLDELDARDAV